MARVPRALEAVRKGWRVLLPGLATLLSVAAIATGAFELGSVTGPWLPLAVVGGTSSAVWALRRYLAAAYEPARNAHWQPATVVASTFGESSETLGRAVRSWLAADAAEVILIVSEDEILTALDAFERDPRVRVILTVHSSKRSAIVIGTRAATHPIVVLADSDTSWEPDALKHLVMPFADPAVGGVGTRHRVVDAGSSLWRQAADWTLDWEFTAQVRPMAKAGGVATLKGRTVAYRRELLVEVLPELLEESFLGRRCFAGDDGRLTWMLLRRGYRTVHQDTAVVWTAMPASAKRFLMQRVRWGRNSYRCYLRAIVRGWFFRQPVITQLTVLQKVLFPVSVTFGVTLAAVAAAHGDPLVAAVWGWWTTGGRGIRVIEHLRGGRSRLRQLPAMVGIFTIVTAAIKYYAFFTMRRQEWMTRGRVDAQGQPRERPLATSRLVSEGVVDGS